MTPTVRSLAEDLIGFDTTSRDSNLALIDYVARYLTDFGVASTVVPDETGEKANLWATIGPETSDGVILSAHTDCVPIDGQDWSTDPFELTERDGRWYGRGTADMKTFLACVLGAVPAIVAADLARPIHLALSYDEESGGAGARVLIDRLKGLGVKADYCVVGEPTSMRVVTAHKGIFTFVATAHGQEVHSSLAPNAVNAAEYVARLMVAIQDLGREKAASGVRDEAYDIPHTTLHGGVIQGGTALNIVPAVANLEFEFRHLPQDDPEPIHDAIERIVDRLSAEMAESSAKAGIEIVRHSHLPALDTDPGAPVVGAVAALTGTGPGKVAYGTEAGLFDGLLGVPTIVCGPGNITEAHRPDEYIELAQVDACSRFIDALVASLETN